MNKTALIISVISLAAVNLFSQQKNNVAVKGPLPKMEFVKINAGEFLMGTEKGSSELRDKPRAGSLNASTSIDNDKPAHKVSVKAFQMMTTEVTCEQWNKIMSNQLTDNPDVAKGKVMYVDILEFIKKLNTLDPGKNYRLPSEAEWEYACWAGNPNDGKSVIPVEVLDRIAWTQGNSGKKVQRVAAKEPNAWGLYDMIGNVWEWCEDEYHNSYEGAPTDGSAWKTSSSPEKGVIRGGDCWMGLGGCQPSAREWMFRNKNPHFTIGFRLVRDK